MSLVFSFLCKRKSCLPKFIFLKLNVAKGQGLCFFF